MDDRVGQQLGNYRLIRLLGRGAFAEVYLAEHQYLERHAAIKVLHVQMEPETQEQFRREARTIAHLQHLHILQVLDFGIQDQLPYLVMDYTPGGTLRSQHRKGTRLPLEQIVIYVKQIASALDFAHQQRVIHRDVKPDNLLLNAKHEVLLSDFGIAVVQKTLDSLSTQEPAGTPLYMAPEQIQQKPCAASDQYALGIVVYEWLTGEPPFGGTLFEVCSHHLYQLPPSLRAVLPELPTAVEDAVFKALAKDPQQRFACVEDFASALEEACLPTLGGSRVLRGVHTLEDTPVTDVRSTDPAGLDQNPSIAWTRRKDDLDVPPLTDARTLQRGEHVDMSKRRQVEADQAPRYTPSASLFLFNQSLLDPGEFYGRARERGTLLNRIRNGASTSIVGPRRVGKTWLMNYLKLVAPMELGTRFLVGYLDATTTRCTTVVGFTTSALEALAVQKRMVDAVPEGLAQLEKAVQELASRMQIPVLCIDEFEGLNDRQLFDLHFFTALRAMAQTGLSLVVVSKSPLIDIVGDCGKTSGFFNVFEQLKIKPFSAKEAEKFAQDKGAKANFTEQERARLLHYGQDSRKAGEYWPLRLQLVGKMLLEDKLLAMRENDAEYYRPDDPDYWQEFEQRLEEAYRGVVR